MYRIINKKKLNASVVMMDVEAPLIAHRAEAGQFVILRADSEGERIPLTIAGYDRELGTVKIIFQIAGATTLKLSALNVGDAVADIAGPLGNATELDGVSDALIVGGGVGTAIALPIAKKLRELGAKITVVIGFRTKELVILEDEFCDIADELRIVTDDGSYGECGNVCMPINEMLVAGKRFDKVFAIGPIPMMKYTYLAVKEYGIPCTVSMNPIMIDGTGMCGGCRLTLKKGGERVVSFACVDGPDFDAAEVDFDEAATRLGMYRDFARHAYDDACNLFKKEIEE